VVPIATAAAASATPLPWRHMFFVLGLPQDVELLSVGVMRALP
jgi:hypothetical protein